MRALQRYRVVALQRENLELCNLAPADISKQIPAWSLMTSAYLFRDYDHLNKTFKSEIGQEFIKIARDQLGMHLSAEQIEAALAEARSFVAKLE